MILRYDTAGRVWLLHALQRTTHRLVARRCRVNRATVTRWANGELLPTGFALEVLENSYGIDRNLWQAPRVRPKMV